MGLLWSAQSSQEDRTPLGCGRLPAGLITSWTVAGPSFGLADFRRVADVLHLPGGWAAPGPLLSGPEHLHLLAFHSAHWVVSVLTERARRGQVVPVHC